MLHRPVNELVKEASDAINDIWRPHKHKPKAAMLWAWHYIYHPAVREHWEEKYLKRHPRFALAVLIVDLILITVMCALLVGGFFAYFILPVIPEPPIVSLTMEVPASVKSGADAEMRFAYDNATVGTVHCATLILLSGGRFVPAEVPNIDTTNCAAAAFAQVEGNATVVPVGDIVQGPAQPLSIKGRFYGAEGADLPLTAELRYWQEAATSPTAVVARTFTTVIGTVLPLVMEMEGGAVYGRQADITVSYTNESRRQLDGVTVKLAPPPGFRLYGSMPLVSEPLTWKLGDLAPDARGTITVTGILPSATRRASSPTFTVQAYTTDGNRPVLVETVRKNVDYRATDFVLYHEILGLADNQVVRPGDQLTVNITYKNGGSDTLRDVRIDLGPLSPYLTPVSPNKLSWDKNALPDLAAVAPAATGTVTTVLKVADDITPAMLGADEHPVISLRATAQYVLDSDPTRPVLADTAPTTLPVATRLAIKAAAFYFTKDGDQLGIGPLPPKVGTATKYRIIVYLVNGTNAADDVRFEAYLPNNVSWTGKSSVTVGEAFDYLPSTGHLIWKVGRLPEFTDGTGNRIGGTFEVSLLPSADQVGKTADLVRDIRVSGTDAVTGVRVTALMPVVTSAIQFDPKNLDRSKVVK